MGKAERLQYAEAYKQACERAQLRAVRADLENFLELIGEPAVSKKSPADRLHAWRRRGGKSKSQGKAHGRTKLTNDKELLPGVDGRALLFKRFKEIARAVAADQGGLDALSEARVQLVRRFAATCVMAEQIEANLCNGLKVDINQHTALSSTLVRLGTRIGIDRRAKHITPNLTDYLELQPAPERAPDPRSSNGDE